LYVVPGSLLAQHPRLRAACKRFVIRQYTTDEGVSGLWAAPLPGVREAPSDARHLQAQEMALTRWVRLEWVGGLGGHYDVYALTEEEAAEAGLGEPVFSTETFDEVLSRGLLKWVMHNASHPLCRRLLMGKPADAVQDTRS
jgi:hypothetical protein